MQILCEFAGVTLTAYGLLTAAAALLLLVIWTAYCGRKGTDVNAVLVTGLISLPLAWACSRLLYGVTEWFSPGNSFPSFGYVLRFW